MYYVGLCLLLLYVTAGAFPTVLPVSAPDLPPFTPPLSLVVPLSTLPPPTLSRGILRLPAPPHAHTSLALAADFARKDKDVGA